MFPNIGEASGSPPYCAEAGAGRFPVFFGCDVLAGLTFHLRLGPLLSQTEAGAGSLARLSRGHFSQTKVGGTGRLGATLPGATPRCAVPPAEVASVVNEPAEVHRQFKVNHESTR